MKLSTQLSDNIFKISIDGDVDANSSIALDKEIKLAIDSGHYKLLINCADLKYISSAGLGVFISYIDELNQNNGHFSFCQMRENVFEVFKLLGLHNLVHISETENASIAYLSQSLNTTNA